MKQVLCKGTPYEIGYQHGEQASNEMKRSIKFYASFFKQYTGKDWDEITPIALEFANHAEKAWPRWYDEIRGIAAGSGCSQADIWALNTRTEIGFGLLTEDSFVTDGCTSLAWVNESYTFLGQNWDWMEEQKENLVIMTIHQEGLPTIKMVTEAGIIGKIGLNSEGVGVCLNAVRCRGFSVGRLPVHLGLRMVLESRSVSEAVASLEDAGLGGSAFVLMGQSSEAVGLEFTSKSSMRLGVDQSGVIIHSNHLTMKLEDADELPEPDSFARLTRIRAMIQQLQKRKEVVGMDDLLSVFDDHDGFPESICRFQEAPSKDATLFNILMDLDNKSATVRIGKVCKVEEIIYLEF